MLSISHAVTGAAIATSITNPWLSVPLILATHYLEDLVPHWDAGTGLGSGKKTRLQAILHELPDLLFAGILVFLFFPESFPIIRNSQFVILNSAPIWGAFLALLPDFLEAPRNFLKWEPRLLRPINRFHQSFHHSIPRPLDGLAPQFLLLVIIWMTR